MGSTPPLFFCTDSALEGPFAGSFPDFEGAGASVPILVPLAVEDLPSLVEETETSRCRAMRALAYTLYQSCQQCGLLQHIPDAYDNPGGRYLFRPFACVCGLLKTSSPCQKRTYGMGKATG
eukprot:701093-Rhodomonas_salina.2